MCMCKHICAPFIALKSGEFSCKIGDHSCSAKFSQNGRMDVFEGETEMMWNSDKLWGKLNLNTKGPYIVELDVTTPFEIEKMSANFHHQGQPME